MKVVIVTGLSGAGKTQAMDCLEDLGYYCIDNMPPALIKSFNELAEGGLGFQKVAFGIDVRGGILFKDLKYALNELERDKVAYKIIYLEAGERVLARRYSETRRSHPLAADGNVIRAIRKEKKELESLRAKADIIIDTSEMKISQLAAEISSLLSSEEDERTFLINILSFGYKNGMPVMADMMFDARFLPNPFYIKSLKPLTGNNKRVQQYVLKHEVAQKFMDQVVEIIEGLIPHYMNEGKYSLRVCFGCTGGQHRSVTLANELNRRLTAAGKRTTIEHRDL
ncbi:MAG: RNase adapter RapZ [Lentihominibacter sp.]|jgi:UPF0042 nucleotide-binding protein